MCSASGVFFLAGFIVFLSLQVQGLHHETSHDQFDSCQACNLRVQVLMNFGNKEIHYQTDPKGSIPTSHQYCSHFCCSNPKRLVAGFISSEHMLCLSLWTRSMVMIFSLNLKSLSILGYLCLPQSCYANIGCMSTIFPF